MGILFPFKKNNGIITYTFTKSSVTSYITVNGIKQKDVDPKNFLTNIDAVYHDCESYECYQTFDIIFNEYKLFVTDYMVSIPGMYTPPVHFKLLGKNQNDDNWTTLSEYNSIIGLFP